MGQIRREKKLKERRIDIYDLTDVSTIWMGNKEKVLIIKSWKVLLLYLTKAVRKKKNQRQQYQIII